MPYPSTQSIRDRVLSEFLASKILDNSLRGYWCEAMVAEALGVECQIVSGGWHAWDLQLGSSGEQFPERIRIQVKNSARVQTWHNEGTKLSECQFNLTYRKRPGYFERDSQHVPCEEIGFMCDVFVLCHHPVEDFGLVNHKDPKQWQFYVLPCHGPKAGFTKSEIEWAVQKVREGGRSFNLQRRPATLERGIRGRRKIAPVSLISLSPDLIRSFWSQE